MSETPEPLPPMDSLLADNMVVMQGMNAQMAVLLDAVAGYKAQAERLGFPSPIADAMAVQYHYYLLQIMMAGSKRAAATA